MDFQKNIGEDFVNFLEENVSKDLSKITVPKNVLLAIQELERIGAEIEPEKINTYPIQFLMIKQNEITNYKYLISQHLSLMKGCQSYAYVYRKFQIASQYNSTKERLEKNSPSKRPTVGEIDSEIEKGLLEARKTEIAYQVASDKLSCRLSWCDQMIMILQNRIREENTDRRQTYAQNGQR